MATDETPEPGRRTPATPVPPRGGKKGAGRASGGRPPGGNRPGPGQQAPAKGPSGGAAARSVANRRAALQRQRQRRNTLIGVVAVAVVVIAVAVLVIVKVTGGGKTLAGTTGSKLGPTNGQAHSSGGTPLTAAEYAKLTSPSAASLAAAAYHYHNSSVLPPTKINDPALPGSTRGKPEVLYVGAEFCPYCATERWALALALSKFGTFSGLTQITSNTQDPGIQHLATVSFYGSTYTSKYLTFVPYETANRDGKALQKLPSYANRLLTKYTQGTIPFVDFNGKAAVGYAQADAHLLHGLNQQQIISQISGGSTTLAAEVQAAAGSDVSVLCQLTHGQPGGVCTAFPTAVTRK